MINLISNYTGWISLIIAALSLAVSIWAIISAKKNNKRIEKINQSEIRLKYRPLVDLENGWQVNPVECTITFNLITKNNEAHLKGIRLLTKEFACYQPRNFPIHLDVDEVTVACFSCYRSEQFDKALLSIDVLYEDIVGNKYITHIEGNRYGLKTSPALYRE